ncbi:MAG: Hsp70 family protein [Micrococcales bacterium]|nr:Hsp70 family protein [Micrococcales bacterium]
MGWVLAVDFGTANTAAAWWRDGRTEKVVLEPGSDTMPSAVVLTGSVWRVGQAALNARRGSPHTFVGTPKARLGHEPTLIGEQQVSGAQLVGHVLTTVRERAVRSVDGTEPDQVVLTHPDHWGPTRLAALHEAGVLAGFTEAQLTMLPEPVAAVYGHIVPSAVPAGARLAVVDVGGGTTDVAVVQTSADEAGLAVIARAGDERLGGNDFDALLYRWVTDELSASGHQDILELLEAPENLAMALTLMDVVRAAKHDLSEHDDAPIAVGAGPGHEVALTITRAEYEALIATPVERVAGLVNGVLQGSGTTTLAHLFLAGGTAYTPALARALEPVTGIAATPFGNPKLVTAIGALRATAGRTGTGPPAPPPPPPPPPPAVPAEGDAAATAATSPEVPAPQAAVPPSAPVAPVAPVMSVAPVVLMPGGPWAGPQHPAPGVATPRRSRVPLVVAVVLLVVLALAGTAFVLRDRLFGSDGAQAGLAVHDPDLAPAPGTVEMVALPNGPSCPSTMTQVGWTQLPDGFVLVCTSGGGFHVTVRHAGADLSPTDLTFTANGWTVRCSDGTVITVGAGGAMASVSAGTTTTWAAQGWSRDTGLVAFSGAVVDQCPSGTEAVSLSTWSRGWLLVCGTGAAGTSMVWDDPEVGAGQSTQVRAQVGGGFCGRSGVLTACTNPAPAVVVFTTDPRTVQRSADTNWFAGIGPGGAGQGTGFEGVPTPEGSDADQVRYLVDVLQRSASARAGLSPAINAVLECRAVSAQITTIDSVAQNRRDLLAALDTAPVDKIPNGAQLVTELRAALLASLGADEAYLAWAREMSATGCTVGTASTHWADGQHYDEQSGIAKVRFVTTWNTTVAPVYDVPTFTRDQI